MGWGSGESTGGTAQPGELDAATPRATDHGRAATKNNLSLAFVGHFHTGAEKGNLSPFSSFQGGGTLDEPYNRNTQGIWCLCRQKIRELHHTMGFG